MAAIRTRRKYGAQLSLAALIGATPEQPGDNNAPQTHRAMHTTNRNFIDDFRTSNADGLSWTALPEFFRNHGFFTTGDTPLAPVESICTDADLRAAAFGFVLSFTALQVLGKSITREFTA